MKKKKIKIEDLDKDNIWNKEVSNRNHNKLNNFFSYLVLTLKSSNFVTQSIMEKWIDITKTYNFKNCASRCVIKKNYFMDI